MFAMLIGVELLQEYSFICKVTYMLADLKVFFSLDKKSLGHYIDVV